MSNVEIEIASPVDKKSEAVRVNPFSRMLGLLYRPTEIFQSLDRHPEWIMPLVFAVLLTVAAEFVANGNRGRDPEAIARASAERKLNASGRTISDLPENERKMVESQINFAALVLKIKPLFLAARVLVAVFLLAILYYSLIRLAKGKTTFTRTLSVTAYSFGIVGFGLPMLFKIIAGFVSSDATFAMNLSFLAPAGASAPITALLSKLDFFSVWALLLAAMGLVSVTREIAKTKIQGVVFGLWGAWIALNMLWTKVF